MKNIKTIWKTIADSKTIRPQDMIAHAILRAMAAKSENKHEIAKYFVYKSFSPSKRGYGGPYQAAYRADYELKQEIKWQKTILGLPFENVFDSDEELESFKSILESMTYDLDRVYTYVFVRQDISPEYQLVQAAHATMCLGKRLEAHHNPHNTYFTVCGVDNLHDLRGTQLFLRANGFAFETFIEPDIGGEPTAIACHPIHWAARTPLRSYNLLKFA